MAYMHGIEIVEVGGSATIVRPVDGVAPVITSPLTATTRENTAWSMTLNTDENVSFAKRSGADSASFVLVGNMLSLPPQDYEGGHTAFVCNLVAMDSAGNVTNFAVTVTVTDVDEIAPLITSAPTAQIAASTGYALTLTANEAVTFEKRTGADGDLFGLAGTTLTLPAQAYNAGKVTFTVNLRAIDGAGNATLFTHVVTIAAPAADTRPPVITSALTATAAENAAWSMTLTADEAVTFAKRTGADTASFGLAGSALTLPAQDYEGGKTQFVCNLVATDAAGNATNFAVTVNISDVVEPVLSVSGPLTFVAGAAAGTLVFAIGNVPAGVTPVILPNDGRVVVAGDAGAGWKGVVGLTASSAGTTDYAVSAAGATGAAARVVVTAPISVPTISLSSAVVHDEGNSGTTTFAYTLTLNRDGNTAALGYTYAVTGSGTNPADATDFGGTLPSGAGTFAAGETSKTITLLVAGDTAVEPSDSFTLSATLTGFNTVTATGTITNDDTAAARLAIASTGFNWPIALDPAGAVPALNGTFTDRTFSQSATKFVHTRAGNVGYFLGGDRYFGGSTSTDGWTAGTTATTYHRVDIVSIATGTVYPVFHPTNGQPIADGNPYVTTPGGLYALRHGALPAGEFYCRIWDEVPVGGRRMATQNVVAASKVSGTAFHTGTGSPANIGAVASYTAASFWAHIDDGPGAAVVLPGDSIENTGRVSNGRLSDGPLRHLLAENANGGPVAVCGNARFGGGPGMFFGPNTNGKDYLSVWEEFGVLVGQTDRWLFRQVVVEHWRNGVTGFINVLKTGIARLRAKDPAIQVFGVIPEYFVGGKFLAGGVVPANGYTTLADQLLVEPNGTTDRQTVIDWYRGNGSVFAEGFLDGIFDADITLRNAAPNQHRYPLDTGLRGKLKVATAVNTANTVVLDFKPEKLGFSYAIDPGNAAGLEFVTLSDTIAPVDNANGTWTCRLQGNAKVLLEHAAEVSVIPVRTIDGTHGTEQHILAKLATPGLASGKQALVARAAVYAG